MDVPALFAPKADEDAAHAALKEAVYRWVLCTNCAAGEACRHGNRLDSAYVRSGKVAKGTCMSGVRRKAEDAALHTSP